MNHTTLPKEAKTGLSICNVFRKSTNWCTYLPVRPEDCYKRATMPSMVSVSSLYSSMVSVSVEKAVVEGIVSSALLQVMLQGMSTTGTGQPKSSI